MPSPSAPASRWTLLSLGCAAAGCFSLAAPSAQASPLPPLQPTSSPSQATGSGGPKRPTGALPSTTNPAAASLGTGGPRRPTGMAPRKSQPAELTADTVIATPAGQPGQL